MPRRDLAIPVSLATTTRSERGDEGVAWLDCLPEIVDACARQWSLNVEPSFENLSYSYAAPARRADGVDAVLKVRFPDGEARAEAEALRRFDGRGCARLLAFDAPRCALLLERVRPGRVVSDMRGDEAQTSAAAGVMRRLWRPAPAGEHAFPLARDWLAAASEPRSLAGTKAAFPWIDVALARARELGAAGAAEVLLHGDLHHDNLLSSDREAWLAIDPHGVVGEPAWEIAPFLFNNLPPDRGAWRAVVRRRADQLADELSLDRTRVYAWSAVRCVQSAWWSLRDSVRLREASVFCGEELARGA